MTNFFDLPRALWTPLYELTVALADNGFRAMNGSGKIIKLREYTQPETGKTITSTVVSVDLEDDRRLYVQVRLDGEHQTWEGVRPAMGESFQAITSPATNADTCVNDLAVHPRYA